MKEATQHVFNEVGCKWWVRMASEVRGSSSEKMSGRTMARPVRAFLQSSVFPGHIGGVEMTSRMSLPTGYSKRAQKQAKDWVADSAQNSGVWRYMELRRAFSSFH